MNCFLAKNTCYNIFLAMVLFQPVVALGLFPTCLFQSMSKPNQTPPPSQLQGATIFASLQCRGLLTWAQQPVTTRKIDIVPNQKCVYLLVSTNTKFTTTRAQACSKKGLACFRHAQSMQMNSMWLQAFPNLFVH